jgi:predicted Fe-Mo cluster-binding NifX family protein
MKVAFPSQDDQGLESRVHGHFGSARHFIVVDTGSGVCERADNQKREHIHGQCQPISALGGKAIDAVVVGGIGRGALGKLTDAGIRIYRAVEGSVRENLTLIRSGRLPEFRSEQTCSGHRAGEECTD